MILWGLKLGTRGSQRLGAGALQGFSGDFLALGAGRPGRDWARSSG